MSYTVERVRVNSPTIDAVGHDGRDLPVEMCNGQTCTHPNVPYDQFVGLINAASPGGYCNRCIRGKYS
jgi:hypothetical protein